MPPKNEFDIMQEIDALLDGQDSATAQRILQWAQAKIWERASANGAPGGLPIRG